MSVPLDVIAMHDMDDRVKHARQMVEYRRVAYEEIRHIKSFQQKSATSAPKEHISTTEVAKKSADAEDPDAISPVVPPSALPMPPGHVRKPLATDTSLSSVTDSFTQSQSPGKAIRRFKEVFTWTTKKKATRIEESDDYSDVKRAMGEERLMRPDPARPRTADPREGGQLPGEDSWDWYQRNINALPPMPSPLHHAFAAQGGEVRKQ